MENPYPGSKVLIQGWMARWNDNKNWFQSGLPKNYLGEKLNLVNGIK